MGETGGELVAGAMEFVELSRRRLRELRAARAAERYRLHRDRLARTRRGRALARIGAARGLSRLRGAGVIEMGDETRTVRIPGRREHEGFWSRLVTLRWACPECGGSRGEPFETLSYDGSRRLGVHGWRNACGHVDGYDAVRREADAQTERQRV